MAPPGSDERTSRLRSDRRLQIMEAAKEVFASRGYHNASVSQIIDRTGIARGTFYLYFSNKRKVFDAILTEALGQLTRRVSVIQLHAGAPSPREQLRRNLIDVLTYLHEDRPLTLLLLNHGLTPDAESAERVESFYAHVTAMIDSSLRRGIEMKVVRPCETELVAACLFGAIRGAVGYMLTTDDIPPAQIADTLIIFSLGGVLEADIAGVDNRQHRGTSAQ